MLIKAIHKSTKLGIRMMRAAWKVLVERAKAEAWTDGAAERERTKAAQEARWQHEREQERDRLWASCKRLAESKALLKAMERTAHRLGVVNEGQGVRAAYLTCTSRLLASTAIRLLRLGAPASGKNLVIEKVFALIPASAIVQVSGSSPKSLAYYEGDDPDALKHKIVYVPEAQIIASKHGEENDFAIMLRSLISEGRIVYQTVVVSKNGGPPETVTIIKNGPIAAIITTARNVDAELKTRLLVMDTDESGAQTVAIAKRILSQVGKAPDLTPWLDLQTWLELDAPYKVEVPFKEAVFTAFGKWRAGFLESSALRIRRDVSSILTAIEASAVLHKAQRKTNADGAIIAEFADYKHAHAAFDEGLSTVHGHASPKVIATVKAIEEIQAEAQGGGEGEQSVGADLAASFPMPDNSVKVTLRDLARRLRVASLATAGMRLAAALDCDAIEQDDLRGGRGGARYYRVLETSEALKKRPSLGVFPPPDWVVASANLFGEGRAADNANKANKKPSGPKEKRF